MPSKRARGGITDLIRQVSDNDMTIKLVFDHVRNIGICALVFGAAAWKIRHFAFDDLWGMRIFDLVIMVCLLGLVCSCSLRINGTPLAKCASPNNRIG
jgi:hypothetical protein